MANLDFYAAEQDVIILELNGLQENGLRMSNMRVERKACESSQHCVRKYSAS